MLKVKATVKTKLLTWLHFLEISLSRMQSTNEFNNNKNLISWFEILIKILGKLHPQHNSQ